MSIQVIANLIIHQMDPILFQSEISDLLAAWHVPGLAVAVIRNGQVILSEGYGVRNIANPSPVTSETLFRIGSCTKAFTVMALGMLVDTGKLDWDKPLKHYLPAFQMWDGFATERLTPRDLLCHRSGLPGHDMVWYASDFDQHEIFNRLRFLEPSCDLRSKFQYSNLMYEIAGLLVEEITGISWEEFIQQRIFDRLGMARSNFSIATTQQSVDFASPHYYYDGQVKVIPFLSQTSNPHGTGPAGNICSCTSDMLKWLQVHLNHGKYDDQTLVSEATLGEMHTPQIFMDDPTDRTCYGYEFSSYGLGWAMRSHKGHFLVEHDGMTDGFYVLTSFMPRDNTGVIALSNGDAYYNPVQENLVPNIVTYMLYDRLLGLQPTDWNALMHTAHAERAEVVSQYFEEQSTARHQVSAPPSHPIEAYLGDYEHPGYGVVSIIKAGDQIQMVFNGKLALPLEHCYYDIFEAVFEINGQRQKMAFLTDLEGNIAQIACRLDPNVKEIIFRRVSDKPE
jgi:CubicO group peptidase (beta-lactamase class C family)